MRHWFYLTETRDRVAIPEADFYPLATAGVIRSQTMVWTDGMEEWVAAGEIHPELFGDAVQSAPLDQPTVLQMVGALSAPLGRAMPAIKTAAVLLLLSSISALSLLILAMVYALDQFGGRGWFLLCGLPLAILPALLSLPLFRVANTSHRAFQRLDRGAFYAKSRALGQLAWIGVIASVLLFLVAVAAVVFALIYRVEIIEFIQTGAGLE